MKRLRILYVLGFFVLLNIVVHGEIHYKVSGQVTRNGKGYPGVYLDIVSAPPEGSNADENYFLKKNFVNTNVKTDREGRFQLYLPPGKNIIQCHDVKLPNGEYALGVGPSDFIVDNKNVLNLRFKLFTGIEIIEANLDILNEIPDTTPSIKYKWGRVPMYSEKECKKCAESYLNHFKNKYKSDIFRSAQLGKPLVFFDFYENPVYYQYPVIVKGVELTFYGIHAVGLEPEKDYFERVRGVTEEEKLDLIQNGKNEKTTWDAKIPKASSKVQEEIGISKDDIIFDKFLCLGGKDINDFYAMFRIQSSGEIILVRLYGFGIFIGDSIIKKLKVDSDIDNALDYIVQIKDRRNQALVVF